jgi:hypothetical protein
MTEKSLSPLLDATFRQFSLLEQTLRNIRAEEYSKPLNQLLGASIGGHVRHSLEYYQCLIEALSTGKLDYDSRPRNQAIEQDPNTAIAAMYEVCDSLRVIDFETKLLSTTNLSSKLGPDDMVVHLPTSVGRELLYGYEHMLHHLALIRIGIVIGEIPTGSELSPELGVAPSTLRYKASIRTDVYPDLPSLARGATPNLQ